MDTARARRQSSAGVRGVTAVSNQGDLTAKIDGNLVRARAQRIFFDLWLLDTAEVRYANPRQENVLPELAMTNPTHAQEMHP